MYIYIYIMYVHTYTYTSISDAHCANKRNGRRAPRNPAPGNQLLLVWIVRPIRLPPHRCTQWKNLSRSEYPPWENFPFHSAEARKPYLVPARAPRPRARSLPHTLPRARPTRAGQKGRVCKVGLCNDRQQ